MAYYDLDKEQRRLFSEKIQSEIEKDIARQQTTHLLKYAADEDTYIRKAAYLAIGRICKKIPGKQAYIIELLNNLQENKNEKIRQTCINAAGEIGIHSFEKVESLMHTGLFDTHHSVRNAVIGSIKKIGEKNPEPVLAFARKYLKHPDKEIRREICHGIELRGRTHPQDILPLLKELEWDKTARVRNTLVHVIGQIAYKKNCLKTVLEHLRFWENQVVVCKSLDEIIEVHERYKNFAVLTQDEAKEMIRLYFNYP
ncbi:MAG: HEAT repeat domain-containing protein [Ferruginibacter sp.]